MHELREPAADPLISIREAARILEVSEPTVSRWIASGHIPAVRIGPRRIRIRRSDLASVQTLASPSAKDGEMQSDGAGGWYIDTGDPSISHSELFAQLRRLRNDILASRGGVPLPDSVEAIREAREERDSRL